jgi:hypothetical protein
LSSAKTKSRLPEVREREIPMDSGFAVWSAIGPAETGFCLDAIGLFKLRATLLRREEANYFRYL